MEQIMERTTYTLGIDIAAITGKPRMTILTRSASSACCLMILAACSTQPGPSVSEIVPALDARVGQADGTITDALASPWAAPSDAWDGRAPLTAEAAVRCALVNNRQLRRIFTEIDRRRAIMRDSQLPPNPTLNMAIGAPLSMGSVPILAMLGQQVDWLWKRDAIIGDANSQLRALIFESAATLVATVVEVRTAYIETASAIEIAELAQRDSAVADRVLGADEASFTAGDGRRAVVNQARMNAAEAQNRVMDARMALVSAKTRLLEAIGRGDQGIDWTVADSTALTARHACGIEPPSQPDDEIGLQELVRARRLDLRAAAARVDGMESRVALAMANRWPTLMLGGGWEQDMTGDQAVMFNLESSIPLFNQGNFRVNAAMAELEIARIDEDRLWQRAVIDTRRALTSVAASEHHAATLRDGTLRSFVANKEILANSVSVGDRPAVELWRSEHQENHVRIQIARAERDRALAALSLERALAGTRLPAAGPSGMPTVAGMGSSSGAPDFDFTALETME
ncbi:MAG: TolC family protein [Planctomycetota bacterium]|nr:TolC family protein [Planctomycetota bacterium]